MWLHLSHSPISTHLPQSPRYIQGLISSARGLVWTALLAFNFQALARTLQEPCVLHAVFPPNQVLHILWQGLNGEACLIPPSMELPDIQIYSQTPGLDHDTHPVRLLSPLKLPDFSLPKPYLTFRPNLTHTSCAQLQPIRHKTNNRSTCTDFNTKLQRSWKYFLPQIH